MAAATSTRRGGDAPVAAIRLRPRLSAGAQRLLKTDGIGDARRSRNGYAARRRRPADRLPARSAAAAGAAASKPVGTGSGCCRGRSMSPVKDQTMLLSDRATAGAARQSPIVLRSARSLHEAGGRASGHTPEMYPSPRLPTSARRAARAAAMADPSVRQ